MDFGKNVIPDAVPNMRVHAHIQRGYWEDVGTIRSYYQANLALTQSVPPFDFYDASRPVYTNPRFLPATKVEHCTVKDALVSEGSILVGAEVEHSLIGIRSRIGRGARIKDSLILGADFYETLEEIGRASVRGLPPVGIGSDSRDPERHRGQERPHRSGRPDRERGGGLGGRRSRLLHPRRHRDRAEERRHPRRDRRLSLHGPGILRWP